MKLKQSPVSEGLDTYVSHKHVHPLHTLVSVVEALLMLIGVSFVILCLYQGSFSRAGQTVDEAIEAAAHLLPGVNAPKQ
jgi:hypothetical protein